MTLTPKMQTLVMQMYYDQCRKMSKKDLTALSEASLVEAWVALNRLGDHDLSAAVTAEVVKLVSTVFTFAAVSNRFMQVSPSWEPGTLPIATKLLGEAVEPRLPMFYN